ncbi:MAG TPA: energy transducer TonB [Candidatus Aquilonibacter sp.]|nr:energy transducer TonB [Candidatus Aquilonibacter sp.]
MKYLALAAATALQLSSAMPALAAGCSQPNRDAKVVDPKPPHVSEAYLKANKPKGAVILTVAVDPKGAVSSVTIKSSTISDQTLVKASIEAARTSTYAPAMHDCKAVAGTYLFRVQFAPAKP